MKFLFFTLSFFHLCIIITGPDVKASLFIDIRIIKNPIILIIIIYCIMEVVLEDVVTTTD